MSSKVQNQFSEVQLDMISCFWWSTAFPDEFRNSLFAPIRAQNKISFKQNIPRWNQTPRDGFKKCTSLKSAHGCRGMSGVVVARFLNSCTSLKKSWMYAKLYMAMRYTANPYMAKPYMAEAIYGSRGHCSRLRNETFSETLPLDNGH